MGLGGREPALTGFIIYTLFLASKCAVALLIRDIRIRFFSIVCADLNANKVVAENMAWPVKTEGHSLWTVGCIVAAAWSSFTFICKGSV